MMSHPNAHHATVLAEVWVVGADIATDRGFGFLGLQVVLEILSASTAAEGRETCPQWHTGWRHQGPQCVVRTDQYICLANE
jgi:hypothetical protein